MGTTTNKAILIFYVIALVSLYNIFSFNSSNLSKIYQASTSEEKQSYNLSSCKEIKGLSLLNSEEIPTPTKFLPILELIDHLPKTNESDIFATCILPLVTNIHFPHFMQMILRCFSFWRHMKHQNPALWFQARRFSQFTNVSQGSAADSRWPYNSGILRVLQQRINLTITSSYPGSGDPVHWLTPMDKDVLPHATMASFATHSKDDIELFKSFFVKDYHKSHTNQNRLSEKQDQLKIVIINREKDRFFIDVAAIYDAFRIEFSSHTVTLKYFENTTFQQQVDFFSNHDVVVSPHGAQLTSILFMQPCSVVFEVFPYGFYVPGYFSSLANISQLVYGTMYLNNSFPFTMDLHTIVANFRTNLCPSVDQMISNVHFLLQKRLLCLSQHLNN